MNDDRYTVDQTRTTREVTNAVVQYAVSVGGHPVVQRYTNGQRFWMTYRTRRTAQDAVRRVQAAGLPEAKLWAPGD